MANSIDVGNLTLKQLLQLYQLRDENKSLALESKQESSTQTNQDPTEFLKLLTSSSELSDQAPSTSGTSLEAESLVQLIDNLINSIDSE